MSVLDILSPLLTAATGAAGTYENAEANANTLKRESVIQAMMLARQARLDAIDAALKGGETVKDYADAHKSTREADAPHLGDPNYASSMGSVQSAEEQAKLPFEKELEGFKGDIARSNELAGIDARGAIDTNIAGMEQGGQNSRQANQQLFEGNQLNKNLAGQLRNKTIETRQTQSGQIIPSFMNFIRDIGGGGNAVTQPIAPVAPTKGLFDDVPNSTPQPQ